MVTFPLSKINLGLRVISREPDGYHHIESCFYPVPWTDILEIIPAQSFSFTASGLAVPGNAEENLCVRAYQLLKAIYPLPPVSIHLHKQVPMGAGLGGGSANASAVLKMLNQLFALQLNASQLRAYSATLGSDCPFFITPSPMLATGRGEHLSPINLTLSGYYLVIIKPSASVSTAEAYRKIRPQRPDTPFIRILSQPIHAWKNLLRNDFEDVLFSSLPDVEDIKNKLYLSGALYAAMSGSGSAVYGLFANPVELDADFAGLQRWSGILP